MGDRRSGAGLSETVTPLGWWAIEGEALLEMLQRAHDGENPDLIYAEAYASAYHGEDDA